MKVANLVLAVSYSVIYCLLFLFSFGTSVKGEFPSQPVVAVLIAVPVVMNWVSFRKWGKGGTSIKHANLTVAVVYSILFAVSSIFASALALVGLFVFSLPVTLNWLTYLTWPTQNVSE